MPVGNSAYEPPTYNKEEEEEQKLADKVYDWWDSMTDQEQFDLMLEWYPTEITKDTDIDKLFGDMGWENQLWIYQRENKCTDGEENPVRISLS